MRRWFIAVFTAHFMLVVLGASLGHLLKHTTQSVPIVSAAVQWSDSAAPADNHPGPLGGDHALGDEFPELPDGAQRVAFLMEPFGLSPIWNLFQAFAVPTPCMAVLDKPPQRC